MKRFINHMLLSIGAFGILLLISADSQAKYKIAVIDSGFNKLDFFTDNVPLCKRGHYDFTVDKWEVGEDIVGHGTAVTKLINDRAGDNNINRRCFLIYKIFGGRTTTEDMLARAIDLAVKNGAKSINLSLGGPVFNYKVKKAMKRAADSGVKIFVAAGNKAQDLNSACYAYPACMTIKNMEIVGALDLFYGVDGSSYLQPAKYSNKGSVITKWELGTAYGMKGTSFACPRALGNYISSINR